MVYKTALRLTALLFLSLIVFGCDTAADGPQKPPFTPAYYVSPETGDDKNSGLSERMPFATLNQAYNAVTASNIRRIVLLDDPSPSKELDRAGRVDSSDAVFHFAAVKGESPEILIVGNGDAKKVSLRGINADSSNRAGDFCRVVNVGNGARVRFENLEITGGKVRSRNGGGIYIEDGGHLTLGKGVVVRGNEVSSGNHGSGIYVEGGTLVLAESAYVADGNDIYLCEGNRVTIQGLLTYGDVTSQERAALITLSKGGSRYVLAGSLSNLTNIGTNFKRPNYLKFAVRVDGEDTLYTPTEEGRVYLRDYDIPSYFVSSTGDDGNSGTEEAPFFSLNFALSRAAVTDVKRVVLLDDPDPASEIGGADDAVYVIKNTGNREITIAARATSSGTPGVTLRGLSDRRVFRVDEGARVIFEGVRISGGNALGSADEGKGGGLYIDGSASVTLGALTVVGGNNAEVGGRGVYNKGGAFIMTSGAFAEAEDDIRLAADRPVVIMGSLASSGMAGTITLDREVDQPVLVGDIGAASVAGPPNWNRFRLRLRSEGNVDSGNSGILSDGTARIAFFAVSSAVTRITLVVGSDQRTLSGSPAINLIKGDEVSADIEITLSYDTFVPIKFSPGMGLAPAQWFYNTHSLTRGLPGGLSNVSLIVGAVPVDYPETSTQVLSLNLRATASQTFPTALIGVTIPAPYLTAHGEDLNSENDVAFGVSEVTAGFMNLPITIAGVTYTNGTLTGGDFKITITGGDTFNPPFNENARWITNLPSGLQETVTPFGIANDTVQIRVSGTSFERSDTVIGVTIPAGALTTYQNNFILPVNNQARYAFRAAAAVFDSVPGSPVSVSAGIANVGVTRGQELSNMRFKIVLTDAAFQRIESNEDCTAWFTNLPEGFAVKNGPVPVTRGSTSITLEVQGSSSATATTAGNEIVSTVVVPSTVLLDRAASEGIPLTGQMRFSVNDEGGVFFDLFTVRTIRGAVGQALDHDAVLTVSSPDYFNSPKSVGASLSSWFTVQNSAFLGSLGLSAAVKIPVQPGDTELALHFVHAGGLGPTASTDDLFVTPDGFITVRTDVGAGELNSGAAVRVGEALKMRIIGEVNARLVSNVGGSPTVSGSVNNQITPQTFTIDVYPDEFTPAFRGITDPLVWYNTVALWFTGQGVTGSSVMPAGLTWEVTDVGQSSLTFTVRGYPTSEVPPTLFKRTIRVPKSFLVYSTEDRTAASTLDFSIGSIQYEATLVDNTGTNATLSGYNYVSGSIDALISIRMLNSDRFNAVPQGDFSGWLTTLSGIPLTPEGVNVALDPPTPVPSGSDTLKLKVWGSPRGKRSGDAWAAPAGDLVVTLPGNTLQGRSGVFRVSISEYRSDSSPPAKAVWQVRNVGEAVAFTSVTTPNMSFRGTVNQELPSNPLQQFVMHLPPGIGLSQEYDGALSSIPIWFGNGVAGFTLPGMGARASGSLGGSDLTVTFTEKANALLSGKKYPINIPADYIRNSDSPPGGRYTTFAEAVFNISDTPAAVVTPGVISGIQGKGLAADSAVIPVELTITVTNDSFRAIGAGEDLSDWITNLPGASNLQVRPASPVPEGATKVTLRITGKPTFASGEFLDIRIPSSVLHLSDLSHPIAIAKNADNALNPRFDIIRREIINDDSFPPAQQPMTLTMALKRIYDTQVADPRDNAQYTIELSGLVGSEAVSESTDPTSDFGRYHKLEYPNGSGGYSLVDISIKRTGDYYVNFTSTPGGVGDGSILTVGRGVALTLANRITWVGDATTRPRGLFTVDGGTLTIAANVGGYSSTIRNNTAVRGAAVTVLKGSLVMNGGRAESHVSNGNSPGDGGGAVYLAAAAPGDMNASFTMTGGIIADNTAVQNGGGIYASSNASVVIGGAASPQVTGNHVDNGKGGAVFFAGKEFSLAPGMEIYDNRADSGGGIYCDPPAAANVQLSGGTLRDNNALSNGGGIYTAGATFVMTGGLVQGNSAANHGGGVYALSSFNMTGGTIGGLPGPAGNSALRGGGVYIAGASIALSMNASSSSVPLASITGNAASGGGGGIFAHGGASVNVGGLASVNGNTAGGRGGGVYLTGSGQLNMTDSAKITGNSLGNTSGDALGSGVYLEGTSSMLMINASAVSSNTFTTTTGSKLGGGVYLFGDNTDIPSLTIGANSTAAISGHAGVDKGAGVYVSKGYLSVEGGAVGGSAGSGNKAGLGGGVYADNYSRVYLKTSGALRENEAVTHGGGIYLTSHAQLTMDSGASDISGNKAAQNGGGIFAADYGTITMDYAGGSDKARVRGNSADKGGGVYLGGTAVFDYRRGLIGTDTNTHADRNSAATGGGGIYASLSGGTLAISGGVISGNTIPAGENGAGIYCEGAGTFTMTGGAVSANGYWTSTDIAPRPVGGTTGGGGGVFITGGTFSVGGSARIEGNAAYLGGGVHLSGGASLVMSGGTIGGSPGNRASQGGGGVYAPAAATVSVSGGAIRGNYVDFPGQIGGGGIYALSSGVQLSAGTIEGNTAIYGGGIYFSGIAGDPSSFSHTGGTVNGNGASYFGGGIFLGAYSSAVIRGVSASYTANTAQKGAAVYQKDPRSLLVLDEGSIGTAAQGNIASEGGGGVYLDDVPFESGAGGFVMNGGSIEGNTVSGVHKGGAGVYLNGSANTPRFTFAGGSILSNTLPGAGGQGGAVYVGKGEFRLAGRTRISANTLGSDGQGSAVYLSPNGILIFAHNEAAIDVDNDVFLAGVPDIPGVNLAIAAPGVSLKYPAARLTVEDAAYVPHTPVVAQNGNENNPATDYNYRKFALTPDPADASDPTPPEWYIRSDGTLEKAAAYYVSSGGTKGDGVNPLYNERYFTTGYIGDAPFRHLSCALVRASRHAVKTVYVLSDLSSATEETIQDSSAFSFTVTDNTYASLITVRGADLLGNNLVRTLRAAPIHGGATARVMKIAGSAKVDLGYLRLTGGAVTGEDYGGGLLVGGNASVTLSAGTEITENNRHPDDRGGYGGGVAVIDQASFTMEANTGITDNGGYVGPLVGSYRLESTGGGGLYFNTGSTALAGKGVRLKGGIVSGNRGGRWKGAVTVDGATQAVFEGTDFINNYGHRQDGPAGDARAAILVTSTASVDHSSGTISQEPPSPSLAVELGWTALEQKESSIKVADRAVYRFSGGSISGNFSGGVLVAATGSGGFVMTGGEIIGNGADLSTGSGYLRSKGGGVALLSGSFIMTGGTIKGNHAAEGGGIFAGAESAALDSLHDIDDGITLGISGGSISGNSARDKGGGISMAKVNATLARLEVTDNTVTGLFGKGGGIAFEVSDGSTSYGLTLKDASVQGNDLTNGGFGAGIYTEGSGGASAALFTDNSNITANGSSSGILGAGVYCGPDSVLTLGDGSRVTWNGVSPGGGIAADKGGGVYVAGKGRAAMNAGSLISQNAADKGGGVYVDSPAGAAERGVFTMDAARTAANIGAIISSNRGNFGSGAYVAFSSIDSARFDIGGYASVSADNEVYLPSNTGVSPPVGARITFTSTFLQNPALSIKPENLVNGLSDATSLVVVDGGPNISDLNKIILVQPTQSAGSQSSTVWSLTVHNAKGVLKEFPDYSHEPYYTDWYVSESGDDSNGFDETHAFNSLKKAMNKVGLSLVPESVIHITGSLDANGEDGGNYVFAVPSAVAGKTVILEGTGGSAALVGTASRGVISVSDGATVVFRNLKITGGNFTDTAVSSGSAGGIFVGAGAKVTLDNVTLNAVSDVNLTGAGGIYLSSDSLLTLTGGNTIDHDALVRLAARSRMSLGPLFTGSFAAPIRPPDYNSGTQVVNPANLGGGNNLKFMVSSNDAGMGVFHHWIVDSLGRLARADTFYAASSAVFWYDGLSPYRPLGTFRSALDKADDDAGVVQKTVVVSGVLNVYSEWGGWPAYIADIGDRGDDRSVFTVATGSGFDLTVRGTNGGNLSASDRSGNTRVLRVEGVSRVTLENLTISGGGNAYAPLNESDMIGAGGGILLTGGSTLVLNAGTIIRSNVLTGADGAVPRTTRGGGIALVHSGAGGGQLYVNPLSVITENEASWGGGIYADDGAEVFINGGTLGDPFNGNQANYGAALRLGRAGISGPEVIFNAGAITGNRTKGLAAANEGGGVYLASGSFTMNRSARIISNTVAAAGYGGAVAARGGVFTQAGGSLGGSGEGNSAAYGGAVFVADGGVFSLRDGEISHNTSTASSAGATGAVHIGNAGIAELYGGYIHDNSSVSPAGVHARTAGGRVKIAGDIRVHENSPILLASGNPLQVTSAMASSAGVYLSPDSYNHTQVLLASPGTSYVTEGYSRFSLSAPAFGVIFSDGYIQNAVDTSTLPVVNVTDTPLVRIRLAAGEFNTAADITQGLSQITVSSSGGSFAVAAPYRFADSVTLLAQITGNNPSGGKLTLPAALLSSDAPTVLSSDVTVDVLKAKAFTSVQTNTRINLEVTAGAFASPPNIANFLFVSNPADNAIDLLEAIPDGPTKVQLRLDGSFTSSSQTVYMYCYPAAFTSGATMDSLKIPTTSPSGP